MPRAALLAVFAFAFACAAPGCSKREADRAGVVVFAAASTGAAVETIARRFEASGGVPVRVSAAASSILAKQILAGARADVFVSANPRWMDEVERKGLVEPGTRRALVRNRLVLVEPKANRERRPPDERARVDTALAGPFAMGDPDHVPVGVYGREALMNMGLWRDLAPRLIRAPDAPAALRLVEMGEATAGLVYASDAAASEKVAILSPIPPTTHAPIEYPAALVRGAGDAAKAFFRALFAAEAAAEFEARGFAPGAAPAGG